MIIRSRAPLRLGLAGGGTDVSPYSDRFGGAVLNSTINLYAFTSLIPRNDGTITFNILNKSISRTTKSSLELDIENDTAILAGVYNRVVKMFAGEPLSFEMSVFVDAPAGSGLGTSSTLLVSVLGAFTEWLKLPLGEYDIARLAWEIERIDLNMAGGKQDQYAATFGGFNFMEFENTNKVIVNPLRVNPTHISELSHNMLLFYTGTSRLSSEIIAEQIRNVENDSGMEIEAMHMLKDQARQMKEAILKGSIDSIGEILDYGWKSKKKMAGRISNELIDKIYNRAKSHGATGGKISGAGGGGYMIFYCPGNQKYRVADSLKDLDGHIEPFDFTEKGLTTWTTTD